MNAWDARRSIWTLRFLDRLVEREYLQSEYDSNRSWMIGSLILGVGLVVAFHWMDPIFCPPNPSAW